MNPKLPFEVHLFRFRSFKFYSAGTTYKQTLLSNYNNGLYIPLHLIDIYINTAPNGAESSRFSNQYHGNQFVKVSYRILEENSPPAPRRQMKKHRGEYKEWEIGTVVNGVQRSSKGE